MRKTSCKTAACRLKRLILLDQIGCSEEVLELLKSEVGSAVSKYIKIDEKKIEITVTMAQNTTVLTTRIPVMELDK